MYRMEFKRDWVQKLSAGDEGFFVAMRNTYGSVARSHSYGTLVRLKRFDWIFSLSIL